MTTAINIKPEASGVRISEQTPLPQDTRQYLPPEKHASLYTEEELFDHHIAKLMAQNEILKTSQEDIKAAKKAMIAIIETRIAEIINTFAEATLCTPGRFQVLLSYSPDKEKCKALLFDME